MHLEEEIKTKNTLLIKHSQENNIGELQTLSKALAIDEVSLHNLYEKLNPYM